MIKNYKIFENNSKRDELKKLLDICNDGQQLVLKKNVFKWQFELKYK